MDAQRKPISDKGLAVEGQTSPPSDRAMWGVRFAKVRAATLDLARDLSPEDQLVQSMPDASPTKWHLAHTAWFFETFLLTPSLKDYRPLDAGYAYLFNSYYEAVGDRHPRPMRGLLTRPTSAEVIAYRAHVDEAMLRLIETTVEAAWPGLRDLIELGLHHEQQHQELILMDIKHAFSCSPLLPAFRERMISTPGQATPLNWITFEGGLRQIGHDGTGFAFDNEEPRHKVWLEPFRLADRLATAGEYLAFIEDGGYRRPDLWLSDGWACVQAEGWRAPLYWREGESNWKVFTLSGEHPLDPSEPVRHLSLFEADAFARWSGARLPTEAEWESAASSASSLRQLSSEVWQWTGSAYLPYPGFKAASGAVGEYNGKFMSGQMVLRGGACVTPAEHTRISYRNFFPPHARWAFSGVRLATDA